VDAVSQVNQDLDPDPGFLFKKITKNTAEKKLPFFDQKLQFTYPGISWPP
jgi:hypothetical protein